MFYFLINVLPQGSSLRNFRNEHQSPVNCQRTHVVTNLSRHLTIDALLYILARTVCLSSTVVWFDEIPLDGVLFYHTRLIEKSIMRNYPSDRMRLNVQRERYDRLNEIGVWLG